VGRKIIGYLSPEGVEAQIKNLQQQLSAEGKNYEI